MIEKFEQTNKAENIRRWLSSVNLDSADILGVERDIYSALIKSQKPSHWVATPIAPLAEPADLDALVGDLFNDAQSELRYQTQRTDNIYAWLSELNNVLKSEIESVEKAVTQATDDVQDITLVVGDENRIFNWISDSFNSNIFIDLDRSTALVDTDYGHVTLSTQTLELVSDITPVIDVHETKGLPGANLIVLSPGKTDTAGVQEPQPVLESTNTRNFGSMFDIDPNTWFEVERNFISQKQKVKAQGRAFVYSEAGQQDDVLAVTKNLDWLVTVEWPDGTVDNGTDGKGIPVTEWMDLDQEVDPNQSTDLHARLVFEITLNTPQAVSSIRLLPFVREAGDITIESITAISGDNVIDVIKDVDLGTNKSTTKLQQEIFKRTGAQTTGSIYAIPTDRDIDKIRVVLTAAPVQTQNGMAHIFQDVLTEYRTERHYVFFKSVDKWKEWSRKPYSQTVPKITSSIDKPKLVGTILDLGKTALIGSKLLTSLTSAGVNLGAGLGAISTWLGTAVPIIGAVLALDNLVGGLFTTSKSSTVKETRTGYDIFKGWRAGIGLRDFSILKATYNSESVLQSVKRQFASPVTKIGLFVDEYIPEGWGAGDWITYFVSEDGSTWTPIPKLSDTTLEKSYTPSQPIDSIFFKAVIKGNPDDIYHSPAIQLYSLQGLPA